MVLSIAQLTAGSTNGNRLPDLLEIFLFEEADGLVNVETVCELHVVGTLDLLNAPVVAGSV